MHVQYLESAAKAAKFETPHLTTTTTASTEAAASDATVANHKPFRVYHSFADGPQELAAMVNHRMHSQDTIDKLSVWVTAKTADGTIPQLYIDTVLDGVPRRWVWVCELVLV
jgi:hypothetical protein